MFPPISADSTVEPDITPPVMFLSPPPENVIVPVTMTGPYHKKPPLTFKLPSTIKVPQPELPPASLIVEPCILKYTMLSAGLNGYAFGATFRPDP